MELSELLSALVERNTVRETERNPVGITYRMQDDKYRLTIAINPVVRAEVEEIFVMSETNDRNPRLGAWFNTYNHINKFYSMQDQIDEDDFKLFKLTEVSIL